jgi:hypothetical protein
MARKKHPMNKPQDAFFDVTEKASGKLVGYLAVQHDGEFMPSSWTLTPVSSDPTRGAILCNGTSSVLKRGTAWAGVLMVPGGGASLQRVAIGTEFGCKLEGRQGPSGPDLICLAKLTQRGGTTSGRFRRVA